MNSETSTSIRPGAQPFFLPGGPRGLLCIHGLGGTGDDFRAFADQLHGAGWTVSVMRVAGHGMTPADLGQTTMADWQASVDSAIEELAKSVQDIFLLGASFGGALAIDAAARHPEVCGIVLVNTPLSYRVGGSFQLIGLKILRLFSPTFPKPGLTAADKARYEKSGSLVAWPISAILDSRKFMSHTVRPSLPNMKTPALLIRNGDDPYVSTKNTDEIRRQYGGPVQEYVLTQKTHRPFRDPEQTAIIAAQVERFAVDCLEKKNVIN